MLCSILILNGKLVIDVRVDERIVEKITDITYDRRIKGSSKCHKVYSSHASITTSEDFSTNLTHAFNGRI